jgi:hypothetical protein
VLQDPELKGDNLTYTTIRKVSRSQRATSGALKDDAVT